jgi:hypothetical protein
MEDCHVKTASLQSCVPLNGGYLKHAFLENQEKAVDILLMAEGGAVSRTIYRVLKVEVSVSVPMGSSSL